MVKTKKFITINVIMQNLLKRKKYRFFNLNSPLVKTAIAGEDLIGVGL